MNASPSNIFKIAAFSDGQIGGNPAGVALYSNLPSDSDMQRIAADVGFSETAFACLIEQSRWRVRYFSPTIEVPFCGHATIALGAVLALKHGDGAYSLVLNEANISVEGQAAGLHLTAVLQSPSTRSQIAPTSLVDDVLRLFGYDRTDLDQRFPPAIAHAGADHFVVLLNSRDALARMKYDFELGKKLMARNGLVTLLFGYSEGAQRFHTRNAFAFGGVYEDPATGAASAALAGYLRDIGWAHRGEVEIIQGEDMGMRSIIRANIPAEVGRSIRVSGTARIIE